MHQKASFSNPRLEEDAIIDSRETLVFLSQSSKWADISATDSQSYGPLIMHSLDWTLHNILNCLADCERRRAAAKHYNWLHS